MHYEKYGLEVKERRKTNFLLTFFTVEFNSLLVINLQI